MPSPNPWTEQDGEQLRELHATGKSLHAIAKTMNRSKHTISRRAAAAGLTWDRTRTRTATTALKDDAKQRRARLSLLLLQRAEELLQQMDQPFLAFSFGGRDNTYTEHQLDRPPPGDIRNLMNAVGIAISKHADLEQIDSAHQADDAKSLLAGLGRALGVNDTPTAS